MKSLFKIGFFLCLLFSLLAACSGYQQQPNSNTVSERSNKTLDTIRIENDSLEYEVIIFDVGFNNWLSRRVEQRGYWSQSYLETQNRFFVAEWNRRFLDPFNYDRNLYSLQIDYDPLIDYGYEVNFLLFNYFLFFQEKYQQKLR